MNKDFVLLSFDTSCDTNIISFLCVVSAMMHLNDGYENGLLFEGHPISRV